MPLFTPPEEISTTFGADEAFLDHCIDYRIASSRSEREAAFRLLYRAYRQADLMCPNRHGFRVTKYHLLPTTNVFIARYGCNVISTMTLVEDGELGLPLEETYRQEIEALRRRGVYLAEVTSQADRRKDFHRYLPVFLRLCRLMVQFARGQRVARLLIASHPRHARFYETYLGCEPMGPPRSRPGAQHQPTVGMCLDLERIEAERLACYEAFFGEPIPEQQLLPQPMPAREQAYFRHFVEGKKTRCTLPAPSAGSGPARTA